MRLSLWRPREQQSGDGRSCVAVALGTEAGGVLLAACRSAASRCDRCARANSNAHGVASSRLPRPSPAEFFKHDTDGDNAISFTEFQKQMSCIRPKRRDAGKSLSGNKSNVSMTSVTSMGSKRGVGGRK